MTSGCIAARLTRPDTGVGKAGGSNLKIETSISEQLPVFPFSLQTQILFRGVAQPG